MIKITGRLFYDKQRQQAALTANYE